jgi:hypothetical protein
MTLNAIVSAIHGNIAAGLAGMPQADYSLEQLADQVWLRRSTLVGELLRKGPALPGGFTQTFTFTPELRKSETLDITVVPAGFALATADIPAPMAALGDKTVSFFGPANSVQGWRLYLDEDYRYHNMRLGAGHRPFGWADLSSRTAVDGLVERVPCHVFFKAGEKPCTIRLRAFFDNAQFVASCASPEDAFPAPQDYIDMIIQSVANEYIKYYRQGHYYGPRYQGRYSDDEQQPQQALNTNQ